MDPPLPPPSCLSRKPVAGTASVFEFDMATQSVPGCPEFMGLRVVPDLLSLDESIRLLAEIEREPFSLAQSGKRKQHHGARVNFNKKKVNAAAFKGLPRYCLPLEARLLQAFDESASARRDDSMVIRRALETFEGTDLFVLRYHEEDSSNLDLHIDDTFAYGEAIFDLSLESDSVMTFLRDTEEPTREDAIECVRVRLPARSAAMLSGAARYEWQHAILHYDIVGRRTSVTFRTLSEALRDTREGRQVLAVARNGGSQE